MSYYFNMAFIQVENELEAYKKAQEMTNLLIEPEVAEKYIKLHLSWLKAKVNLQPNDKLTTPTSKLMGFFLPSLAYNRTSFSDFGIQV